MDWIGDAFNTFQGILDSASAIAIALSFVALLAAGIVSLVGAIRR